MKAIYIDPATGKPVESEILETFDNGDVRTERDGVRTKQELLNPLITIAENARTADQFRSEVLVYDIADSVSEWFYDTYNPNGMQTILGACQDFVDEVQDGAFQDRIKTFGVDDMIDLKIIRDKLDKASKMLDDCADTIEKQEEELEELRTQNSELVESLKETNYQFKHAIAGHPVRNADEIISHNQKLIDD